MKNEYEKTLEEVLAFYNDRDICDTAEKRDMVRNWMINYARTFLGKDYKIKY